MRSGEENESSLGIAIVVWICTFISASVQITEITNSQGLGLVWGVFIALVAFEIARRSFRRGLIIIALSLVAVFLVELYTLLR